MEEDHFEERGDDMTIGQLYLQSVQNGQHLHVGKSDLFCRRNQINTSLNPTNKHVT